MRRIIVVLPHPLGPITETNSPRETSILSPSTAVTFPNRLVTPTSRTSDSITTIDASIRRSESRCRVRSPQSAHDSGGTCSSKSAAPEAPRPRLPAASCLIALITFAPKWSECWRRVDPDQHRNIWTGIYPGVKRRALEVHTVFPRQSIVLAAVKRDLELAGEDVNELLTFVCILPLTRRAWIQRISVTIHHVSPFSELLDPDPIADHG